MISIYIITTAHPYNDVRVTHRLGHSFVESGFNVSWFGPEPPDKKQLHAGINFIFFKNISRIDRYFAWFKLWKLLKSSPPADIYFAVDPDSAIIANHFAGKFGRKSVFDIHEIFHRDMLYLYGLNKFWVKIIGLFIKKQIEVTCKKTSLVIGVGETRLKPYSEAIHNSMIIRHCVPRNYANEYLAEPMKTDNNEVLILQGKVSQHQGTLKMLLAAQMASEKLGRNIKIVLFKIFSKDLKYSYFNEFVTQHKLDSNYILMEPIPFNEMFQLMAKCDVGVISYQSEMGVECMPNRIFEYLSVGLPVIVPCYAVEMVKILETYNCGLTANMENVEDISSNLIRLISNPNLSREMGLNGRMAFEKGCNWEEEVKGLLEWIQRN